MDRLTSTQRIKIIKTYYKNSYSAIHRYTRFAENIAFVRKRIVENPNVSIPRRSQELEMYCVTL